MSTSPAMDARIHDVHPLSSPSLSNPSSHAIVSPATHAHGTGPEMAIAADTTTAKKRGFFGRAVDGFKPPLDQKGWIPDRVPRGDGTTIYVNRAGAPGDPEKGIGGDACVQVTEEGGPAGIESDDVLDDNGGLKRALHGRHLQVNNVSCAFWRMRVTNSISLLTM